MKIDKVDILLKQIIGQLNEVKGVDPEMLELQAVDVLCEKLMENLSIMDKNDDLLIEKDKHEIRESLLSMFFLGHILGINLKSQTEQKPENHEN